MRLGKPQNRLLQIVRPTSQSLPSFGSFMAMLPGGLPTESLSIVAGKGPHPPPGSILGRCSCLVSNRELTSWGDHGKGGERKRLHRGAKHDGEPFSLGRHIGTPQLSISHLPPAMSQLPCCSPGPKRSR